VDPWGDYGGDKLAATIAHEFNHATHAANDWYDLPISFEMSASYVDQFYGPQDVRDILNFQKHLDWGLLRNDSYLSYYMYDPTVKWVVRAVPGVVVGSDGETVDVSSGAARIPFASDGTRTLIVTALPASASGFDPNYQTAFRYPVSVRITP
jgi:hypothetical protein